MNKRGVDFVWGTIIGAALVLLLFIVYTAIFGQTTTKVGLELGTVTGELGFQACKLQYRAGQTDIDRDKCSDIKDVCVFDPAREWPAGFGEKAEAESLKPNELAYLGNQYCDNDDDGVPDACDQDPSNPKVGCLKDPQTGKCEPIPESLAGSIFTEKCRRLIENNMRISSEGGIFA